MPKRRWGDIGVNLLVIVVCLAILIGGLLATEIALILLSNA